MSRASAGTVAAGTTPSGRVLFVDLARAVAVLMMVQGHTLDVLLAPALRENAPFDAWLFVRGLTSCTFLLLAGFSFTLATTRHWEAHMRPSGQVARRLRKFGFFILLGYAMHFPVHHVRELQLLGAAGWRGFTQVDILQCIGVSLILLQALAYAARTPRRFAGIALGLAAATVFLTPFIWQKHWGVFLPTSLAAYFHGATGSRFPLFPWAGYVFLGAALGYAYVSRRDARAPLPFSAWLLRVGALVGLSGFLFDTLSYQPYGPLDFWKTSPNLFLIRAGCVMVLLAGFAAMSQAWRKLPRTLHALSAESMTLYFLHVCFLYGSIWSTGLLQHIGPRLGLLPALAWIALLWVVLAAFARLWNWAKQTRNPESRLARTAFALALAYRLL